MILFTFLSRKTESWTDIFQVLDTYYETTRKSVLELHARYGDVVVIGPNTLIFSDPGMIDVVYGNRNPLPKVCRDDFG